MSSDQATIRTESVPSANVFADLIKVPVFAEMTEDNLSCLGTVELITAAAGAAILPPGSRCDSFYVVLEGEIQIQKTEQEGQPPRIIPYGAGEAFGELSLLKGVQSVFSLVAVTPVRLVRFVRRRSGS
jgi:CRP-like cAMP-binding protein